MGTPEIEAEFDAVLGPGHYVNARQRIAAAIRRHDPVVVALVGAARDALLVLDEMLGDTDLDGDDSGEFVAYQRITAALAPWDGGGDE